MKRSDLHHMVEPPRLTLDIRIGAEFDDRDLTWLEHRARQKKAERVQCLSCQCWFDRSESTTEGFTLRLCGDCLGYSNHDAKGQRK